MSIIKRTIEQEIQICDTCGTAYDVGVKLPSCFICGENMCFSCQQTFGKLNLCEKHHKDLWVYIKDKRKEHDATQVIRGE